MSLIQSASPYVCQHIHSNQSHDALSQVYIIQCRASFINIPLS